MLQLEDWVISHLAIQTAKNLQVQLLDDFSLRLTSLGVVVETRCGVDFQHPVLPGNGRFAYVTVDHEVNAAQTQVHVACELYRELSESDVDACGHINCVAARRKIGIIKQKHLLSKRDRKSVV